MGSLFACNAVTGADEFDAVNADDDEGGTKNETIDLDGTGGATAQPTSAQGQTAGPTTAANGSNGAGGAPTSTSQQAATTGAGAGPTDCMYPQGPYGVAVGQVVPPTLSWQGYAPGATSPSTITSEDLFDCDGSRGIDAVVVDVSQFG